MPIIMICYYIISAYLAVLLIWNFFREKKSIDNMLLYLLVLIPLILRLLRPTHRLLTKRLALTNLRMQVKVSTLSRVGNLLPYTLYFLIKMSLGSIV